jgi:DNA repair exonuclease SbcCD ATPase subunit
MITFKKISWANFLSTGNQPTEVILDGTATTLIIGANGAGKSTILDALTFVLYGKSFRKINKAQLINSTNEKSCLVDIEFDVNSVEWKIQRGIKPNIFKITRNGEELDQSHSAIDQQKWLEQNVLKMNYKSFTQIVILGSSTFVPFMQLPASSRREVVEDLLDIKIFSSMNDLIKSKIRIIREETKTLQLKKESIQDKVDMQKDFIEKLESQSKEDITAKTNSIDSINTEIETLFKKSLVEEDRLTELNKSLEKFEGVQQRLREFGSVKGKLSQRIQTIVKEHKFFSENTVCPTCDQDIEESFRVNRISDSQSKAEELREGYEKLQEAIKDEELRESQFNQLTKETTKVLNEISSFNVQISSLQKQVRGLESEIQTVTSQIQNRNTEHEKLETLRSTLDQTYDELTKRKENISYHDFVYSLLKDGGVKAKIIKKYLPLINQQVNNYLQMMDFYINFSLDSEFTETIESPIHEDFSYASFSEGEKARIDLSLILTWREVARIKNSVNTNLMLLDEVFDSSLDTTGSDELMKIIRYGLPNTNVVVISHKEGMEDKFDRILQFEKVRGFSRIKPTK